MAIHIVGVNGFIGSTIKRFASQYALTWGQDIYGYSSPEISLQSGRESSFSTLKLTAGDSIINCVGYSAVDKAETDTQQCYQLNAFGPANLARYALQARCHFISLSTDYVFSQSLSEEEVTLRKPWKPADPTHTQCVYGASKLLGEQYIFEHNPAAMIVRTSWVYATPRLYDAVKDAENPAWKNAQHKSDFVSFISTKALAQERVYIVNDQVGSPTWVDDIAQALIFLAQSPQSGEIFHYSGAGECSWYSFAQEIYHQLDVPIELVQEISSETLNRPAIRPRYSALGGEEWDQLQLYPRRPWQEALGLALAEYSH